MVFFKKQFVHLFISACVGLIIIDGGGAIASRMLNFDFSWLTIPSAILYVTFSFLVGKRMSKWNTIIATLFLGLFDVTFGWYLATILRANMTQVDFSKTPFIAVLISAVIICSIYMLTGLFGWWLANRNLKAER